MHGKLYDTVKVKQSDKASLKNKILSFSASYWYKGIYRFKKKSVELTVNFSSMWKLYMYNGNCSTAT